MTSEADKILAAALIIAAAAETNARIAGMQADNQCYTMNGIQPPNTGALYNEATDLTCRIDQIRKDYGL